MRGGSALPPGLESFELVEDAVELAREMGS
jgi:hypothetical protein